MPLKRFAYTDESGNTGLNLFDENQPTFWTGTLIAFADVDSKYFRLHSELLELAGVKELHGAQLGLAGIEKIAKRVAHILKEKRLHFLFGRVDKKFLAATKMFDLVFDSGANKAMPSHAYGIKQLRLINTIHFVQLLEEDDLIEFWSIFKKQDVRRFGVLLSKIEGRVEGSPYDPRSKQILGDVLAWGARNPDQILDPFGEKDSPNFVAFTGLFEHLHRLHTDHGHVIGNFVHDEQNQFMKHFRQGYELLSRWRYIDGPLAVISDIETVESFDGELIVRSSHDSFGLQLVDVCLWLVKRALETEDILGEGCSNLLNCIFENSWLTRFDFANIARQVEEGSKIVENLPLSAKQLEAGRKLLTEVEEKRQLRLQ